MPRENSKCRAWEQERRNRLNVAFTSLSKLLPNYEPSLQLSKIEILNGAANHIQELEGKIKTLLAPANEEVAKKTKGEELKTLHERVKKLLKRNETLCDLLHQAKITIPKNCTLKKWRMKCHLQWSNKILPEQAKIMQKKELEKENDASSSNKKAPVRKLVKAKAANPSSAPRHRKAIINRDSGKRVKRRKKPVNNSCVIVLTQASLVPQNACYVITQAPSNNILGSVANVNTKPALLSNPVVSCKPAPKLISVIPPQLGPGTLILGNGTIVPVLPPIIKPQQSLILVRKKTPADSATNQIMPSSTTTNSVTRNLTKIRPKYCTTKTTQVNKVPIPALTSRYANKDLVLGKTAKTNNKNETKKTETAELEKRKIPVEKAPEAKKSKTDEKKENNDAAETPVQKQSCDSNKDNQAVGESDSKQNTVASAPAVKTVESQIDKKTNAVTTTAATSSSDSIQQDAPDLNMNHSELSNDIFATLQVPTGCQNPESTSPTAAFLLAFPLVSSLNGVKVTEVTEDDNTESQRGTPTLLQIGTMDNTKPTQSESLTPSLLNLDNLSFFSSKDMTGFYNTLENINTTNATTSVAITTSTVTTSSGFYNNNPCHNTSVASSSVAMTTTNSFYNSYTPTVTTTSGSSFYNHSYRSAPTTTPVAITTNTFYNSYMGTPTTAVAMTTVSSFYNSYCVSTTTSVTKSTVSTSKITNESVKTPAVTCFEPTNRNYAKQSDAKPNESITNNNNNKCVNYFVNCSNNFNNSDPSKICTTCSYATIIKSYPDPLYTNSNSYNYNSASDGNFNQNFYKTIDHNKRNNYGLNYENYHDYRKTDGAVNNFNYYPTTDQKYQNQNKRNTTNNKGPINWMTTPDYNLQSFNKDNEFTSYNQNYFNNYTNENQPQENRKNFDANEDHQFSWSPTKIPSYLDTHPTFVSSTLPTLVGDLALNFGENKDKKKDNRRAKNYEQAGNFLSVSQLVEQQQPARTTTRRNSGNRNANKKVQQKATNRNSNKETNKETQQQHKQQYDERLFCTNANSNNTKNPRAVQKSNYSAEALIGTQMANKNQQNYGTTNKSLPTFLPEIPPYFPVDLQQTGDSNYIQQNQNFTHNYPSNTLIPSTTTYLNNSNFMHDTMDHYHHDNFNLFGSTNRSNSQKNCSKTYGVSKKATAKRKSENVPNFVDFTFLPPITSTSINSPILPDDFHTHTNFLQPPTPQIYPCKNPLLKQNDLTSGPLLPPLPRANIQLPEISPSINSAAGITNFNLSTIFPEINKGISDNYLEPRIKEHHRNYVPPAQVPFNEKPTFNFNYTSQTYNHQ